MQAFLLVIHVLLAAGLIGLILIQHGKGADAGAAFGSGASATVFGSRGSASFLTRLTTFLAIGFFANSLALAYLSARAPGEATSLMDKVVLQPESENGQPAGVNAGGKSVEQASAEESATVVKELAPVDDGEKQRPADVPQVNQ